MLAQRARAQSRAILPAFALQAALPAARLARTRLRAPVAAPSNLAQPAWQSGVFACRSFTSSRDGHAAPQEPSQRSGQSGGPPSAAPPAQTPPTEESAGSSRWRYRHWKGEVDLKNLQQTPLLPPPQPPSPPPPTLLQRSDQACRSIVGHAKHAIREPAIIRQWTSRAWAATKSGAHHLWSGTKLLGADIATAFGLIRKMARGEELSWRERRQLRRTAADLARVGPFLVIVLVPFMELALPLLLKLWPGFLPSTFQTAEKRDNRVQREMKLRLEIAEALQEAVTKLAKGHATADNNGAPPARSAEATQLLELLSEVRHGRRIPSAELSKLAPLFSHTLTLEKLSRKQLVRLSRFFDGLPYLSTNMLRFQLQRKIRRLRQDDRLLQRQLNSLSKPELRAACHERGIRSVGLTEEGYRRQLQSWLNLSLKYDVPDSLLLLSRPIGLLEQRPSDNQIREALLEFDEAALEEIVPADQEPAINNDERLKLLRIENKRIKEEEKQRKEEAAEQHRKEQEAASQSAPATAVASIVPSASPPSVDLLDLSSKLLSLLHRELESDRSLREKAQQLKDKHAESHAHAHDAEAPAQAASADSAAAAANVAEPPSLSSPPSSVPSGPAASQLSSNLLASFLDSKVDLMLREVEQQLGTDPHDQQEDKEQEELESAAESDGSIRRWIERTLAQRDIRISEDDAARLQRMLQAMCESEQLPLTRTTLARLMRVGPKERSRDPDQSNKEDQASKRSATAPK